MNKRILYMVVAALMLLTVQASAQQTDPTQTTEKPKPKPAPRPKPLMEQVREYVQKLGATIDEKSSSVMVVSNYVDEKAGTRTNVVILQGKNKNLLSFYVYNFGNVKNAPNKEELYRYLLNANEKISLGTFFVDDEDDIGYKYLINTSSTISKPTFDSIYLTMIGVEREHKPQIRKLLGLEPERPLDPKKAAEDKPPFRSQ